MKHENITLPPQSLHISFKGSQQDVYDLVSLQRSRDVLISIRRTLNSEAEPTSDSAFHCR